LRFEPFPSEDVHEFNAGAMGRTGHGPHGPRPAPQRSLQGYADRAGGRTPPRSHRGLHPPK
jgi:hypothetical protein